MGVELLRFDMSEYMEKHSVARLIGAPPGYVEYDEGGALTESIRRRPYQVILFDEIEKAHPDVFNILLQVLDDGRLTDGQGRTVDFRNCVLVMTSNLGSDAIQVLTEQHAGEPDLVDKLQDAVMAVVGQHFRPEFINRLDELIVFEPLSSSDIRAIAYLQVHALNTRLVEQDITVHLSDALMAHVSEAGYDPVYGARPLKRAFQRIIENPLANGLLEGRFGPGDEVTGEFENGEVTFRSVSAVSEAS